MKVEENAHSHEQRGVSRRSFLQRSALGLAAAVASVIRGPRCP